MNNSLKRIKRETRKTFPTRWGRHPVGSYYNVGESSCMKKSSTVITTQAGTWTKEDNTCLHP